MNSFKNQKYDFRNVVFDELIEIREKNKNLFILTADISAYSLESFKDKFKKNFFNLGITEQGMISIACGMAMTNKKVFAFSMIPFLIMRAFEHIKVDISSTNFPITLIGLGSGLSFDTDGPSAQATTDISLVRTLPNFFIFNPSDPVTACYIAKKAYESKNPVYIRLDKSQQFPLYKNTKGFHDGFVHTKSKAKICIISTGIMVHKAFEIKKELSNKINIGIIDIFCLKPINEKKLLEAILSYDNFIILDENTIRGGLVSIILELFGKFNISKKIKTFAIPDEHCFNYGKREWLHTKYKIDNNSIIEYLKKFFC